MRILILGGTGEARDLAAELTAAGADVVSSLAGRVREPRLPDGPVRIGGFGGAAGLAGYLRAEAVTHIVDATHPFAAAISANAAEAAEAAGLPLLVLRRPPWPSDPCWQPVPDIAAAAAAVRAWPGESYFSPPAAGTWARSPPTAGTDSWSGRSTRPTQTDRFRRG